jgi:hypothetical protein
MDFRDKPTFDDHYELVDKHLTKYFKDARISVFHEIPTLNIHMDVYHVRPANSEFEVLITSGMSSIAMNVSTQLKDPRNHQFAELMVLLPKGIDFGQVYPAGTKYDWIISMLKQSAKFPHFYDTWVGIGHSIQAEENMEPYSKDTEYVGCLVLPTMTFPKNFEKISSPRGPINIYSLFPLYKEELEFKIQNGFNAFAEFLIKNNTKEIIDFNRTNFCKSPGALGKLKGWTKRLFE